MNVEFRMTVEMPRTRYVLNRSACVMLLATLETYGDACGDPCKRLREDLRKALATDAAAQAEADVHPETQDPEVTEEITVNLVASSDEAQADDGVVRCAWCDEAGEKVPMQPGDAEQLYVCRTQFCPRKGKPAARQAFETLYAKK